MQLIILISLITIYLVFKHLLDNIPKINHIAYNYEINSYMICVDYIEDNNWAYKLCDKDGNVTSNIEYISEKSYKTYKWKELNK